MSEFKKFDLKNWLKTILNHKKDSVNWAKVLNRITVIALIGYLFSQIYSPALPSNKGIVLNSFISLNTTVIVGFLIISCTVLSMYRIGAVLDLRKTGSLLI